MAKNAVKKTATRKPAPRQLKEETNGTYGTRGDRGDSNFADRGNTRGRGRGNGDSPFTRVTALWPGKKRNIIGSGKTKREQLEKVVEALTNALRAGKDVLWFVFEPNQYSPERSNGQVVFSIADDNYQGGGNYPGQGKPDYEGNRQGAQNFQRRPNNDRGGWERNREEQQYEGEDVNFNN